MPNLAAALRAEVARVVDLRSIRAELRAIRGLRREVATIERLVRARGRRAARAAVVADDDIAPHQIRAARTALGESRQAFAKRLGVSTSIVFLWESGRSRPRRVGLVAQLKAAIAAAAAAPRVTVARPMTLTPARRAPLKVHGRYIGLMRNLPPRQKDRVKALRRSKGYRPAITLARRLAAR